MIHIIKKPGPKIWRYPGIRLDTKFEKNKYRIVLYRPRSRNYSPQALFGRRVKNVHLWANIFWIQLRILAWKTRWLLEIYRSFGLDFYEFFEFWLTRSKKCATKTLSWTWLNLTRLSCKQIWWMVYMLPTDRWNRGFKRGHTDHSIGGFRFGLIPARPYLMLIG